MKLGKNLMRKLLMAVEADTGDPRLLKDIRIEGQDRMAIAYQICILAEAGFLHAHDTSTTDGFDWQATRLTFEGHEFLDTIRDPAAWRYTKETAKNLSVATVKGLYEIGKAHIKQKLIEGHFG